MFMETLFCSQYFTGYRRYRREKHMVLELLLSYRSLYSGGGAWDDKEPCPVWYLP